MKGTFGRLARACKRTTLNVLERSGAFELVANTAWRSNRLLILCYHGISLKDEHRWRPALYMQPEQLESRLKQLKCGGYNVLSLAEGLQGLYDGTLPDRSVALTFDDGGFDFYQQAYPILSDFGYPVTVYLSTYYSEHQNPIFGLVVDYLLWKGSGKLIPSWKALGSSLRLDTRTRAARANTADSILGLAESAFDEEDAKTRLAASLADCLEIDFDEILSKRMLHLMRPDEVAELSAQGVDVQLHTHRHRSPERRSDYERELRENRISISKMTGTEPSHFCYPSGNCRDPFPTWLSEAGIASGVTCMPGLACARTDPHLLPRLVDTSLQSPLAFASWISGTAEFLPRRKYAPGGR